MRTKESFASFTLNLQCAGACRGRDLRAAANKSRVRASGSDGRDLTRSVSESCALPGMQISRQTSTFTSAPTRTGRSAARLADVCIGMSSSTASS